MTKTEKAIQQMETWAQDNSHGYDQIYRWGEKGDYDCSAAVIQAWENAGVPVKSNGATYTGNMLIVFKKCGFTDVTSKINLATGAGLKRGDVLLNTSHHTAMYCGNNKEVEASINEKGTATGGKPGDQTGKEFLIRSYRNYPWNYVLRYQEGTANSGTTPTKTKAALTSNITVQFPEIRKGCTGVAVSMLQTMLGVTVDGDFGAKTETSFKTFQKNTNQTVDGICGKNGWKAVIEHMKANTFK